MHLYKLFFLIFLFSVLCCNINKKNCAQKLIITTYQGIKNDSLIRYNSTFIIGYIYKIQNKENKYLLHTCIVHKENVLNEPFRISIKENGFLGLPFVNITNLSKNQISLQENVPLFNNSSIASSLLINNKNLLIQSNTNKLELSFFKKKLLQIKRIKRKILRTKVDLRIIVEKITNTTIIKVLANIANFQYTISKIWTNNISIFIQTSKLQIQKVNTLLSFEKQDNTLFQSKTIFWNNLSYTYIKEWIRYINYKLETYQKEPTKILLR